MGALLQQFMNKYPYTDFHELNADWLIKTLMEMINQVENFVSLNAIKYADPIQWNIVSQYEKNTVVIDPLTGTAYISVQPVPSGVALTRTEYWTVVFDLGSFVVRAAKNFSNRYEADTTLTATFPTTAGQWLVWGDTLYEALVNITAGDQYVVGSNIKHITMEEVVDALAQAINDVDTKVGDLNDLTTLVDTSIVDAINYLVIFTINEAKNFTNRYEAAATLTATFASSQGDWLVWGDTLYEVIVPTINIDDQYVVGSNIRHITMEDIDKKVGNLSDLTTSDKTSIVNAINELDARFTDNILNVLDYGAVGDGVTDNYSAFQAWIRDVGDTGKIGYIPNGTYLFSTNNTVTYRNGVGANSVTIIGQNRENTILKRADGSGIAVLDVRNCHADFSNFTIDLNGVNDEDDVVHYAISYVEMKSLHVHEIDILNTGFVAVLGYSTDPTTKFNYDVNFENVNISGIGAISGSTYPWSIVSADTRESSFRNMKISNINYYGLEVKNYSRDVNISDVVFENCGHGVNFGGDHNGGIPVTGYYCMNCNVNNIVCRNVKYPIMANQVFMINATNFTVNSGVVDFAWLYKCRCMNLEFNGYADSSCDAILYSEGCNEINIDLNGHCPSFSGYLIKNNIANGNHDDNIVLKMSGYFPDTNKVDNVETRIAIINLPTRQTYNYALTNNTL